MPANKDLKRRVRARMAKTGEAYTTARMHVLAERERSRETASLPLPDDYPGLAGMSDEAVAARTGRGWAEWVRFLDAEGAYELPHSEIARLVLAETGLGWWSQTVAVGYERIRGLREKGQRSTGDYEASRSKTFPVPVERLFAAFADEGERERWLGPGVAVTKATPHKTVRMRLPDGTPAEAYLVAKGPGRSSVQVQQRRLPSKEAAAEAKQAWGERLEALAAYLG